MGGGGATQAGFEAAAVLDDEVERVVDGDAEDDRAHQRGRVVERDARGAEHHHQGGGGVTDQKWGLKNCAEHKMPKNVVASSSV
mgnify:CR=1 FL=1